MRQVVSTILVGAIAILAIHPVLGQEDKGAEKARKTLTQFWGKFDAQDLDGLLNTVEAPFCFNDGNPDKIVEKVIADKGDLKKLMKEMLDGSKGKKSQLKIVATLTYPAFLKETGDLLKEDGALKKDRQALDASLKKDGYVVFARISEGKDGALPVGFLIAAHGGELKVTGMLLGLTNPKKD